MLLDQDDLVPHVAPPRPHGRPLSNAELLALSERDLSWGDRPVPESRSHDIASTYTRNVLRARYEGADVSVERNKRLAYLSHDCDGERPWNEGKQYTAERFAP